MSHIKAKIHQIRFPSSVRPSVRLLDGVWHYRRDQSAQLNSTELNCLKFAALSRLQLSWITRSDHCLRSFRFE